MSDQTDVWKDNHVQFARLIAETEAAGAFTDTVLKDMSDGMDLTTHEIGQIIDRAQAERERIKLRLCPPNDKAQFSVERR